MRAGGIGVVVASKNPAYGRMKSKEDVVVGLDTFPATLLKLFRGENFGKLVLQIASEQDGLRTPGAPGRAAM